MEHNYRYPPPQRFPSTAPIPYNTQPNTAQYPPSYSNSNVPPRPNFEYNYPPPVYQRTTQPYYGYEYSCPNVPASTQYANYNYYNQYPNTNVPSYDSQSLAIKPYEDCNDYSKALNDYKKDSDEYKKTLDRKHKQESRHSNERTYNNDRRSSRSYNNRSRSRSRSRRPHYGYRRSRTRSRSRGRNRSRSTNRSHFRKYARPAENYKNSRPVAALKGRENNLVKTRDKKPLSERETLLAQWRKNYCATSEEMNSKLEELSKYTQEETIEREKSIWTRTTPADLFYVRDDENPKIIRGTTKLAETCDGFYEELVLRAEKINAVKPKYEPPQRKKKTRLCKHKSEQCSEDSDSTSEDFSEDEEENIMEELTRKQQHPDRLHPEMWYNDPGEMNDGPLCRCSLKSRKSGIRHGIYAGEKFLKVCDKNTNNSDKLYHYRITISPPTNFLTKTPTIIKHDEHEFIFEGFSMFSHFPLIELPTCKVIRFNIEYTILYIEEKHPDNFTIKELDLFHDYLFRELLELVDLDFRAAGDINGCSQFHFMPRFVRDLPDNGREILSMKEVLQYLLDNSKRLIKDTDLSLMVKMSQYEWQSLADEVKGMVVTYPGKKPCSVRVDQLDRNSDLQIPDKPRFPDIVHFGIRPPQLSYAGNPEYQKAWRDYVKFRHLLANMSKPTFEDKRKLEAKEIKLQEMRTQSKMKRDVTVAVSAEGFYRTGIMCDIIQHAMLIPVLVCHLRFHHSLNVLEENIDYKFRNRALLQLALTHPSYRENFGTNPDHARNSLTNCGIRQPEYGDRRIHYMNTRKRGINTLINIMSRFGKKYETESNITHNERLEFLGDAVVEFLSSIHLFRMFPDLEEGGLATYRAAIVQNQHLAVLARTLCLDQFMLYAHGSDLCHDLELRHAMANCFEALMGALFLDGGIEVADKVFGSTLFKIDPNLLEVWENLPPHPLQEQEPTGDRQWIPNFELLQKLTKFEESIGVEFKHIRMLARAFTDRSIGYTNLTLGSNQRLEFLGDTVLQLIASEYLYKYFPEHHEGHLSLLRSSLVNNRTQAVVCDDLGMANYAVYNNPKAELKTKDRADLLEAFVGALYIDKGLEYCRVFCQVTLFPRLQDFIMNQDWNDPKSKLQQCCLTLRTMDGGEPDIPVYKVIECKGPTNTRVYTVAVYFRGRRLAKATGHSIQQAEMNSAKKALEISHDLFPQLDHQKRVIAKSMKKQKYPNKSRKHSLSSSDDEGRDGSQTFNKRLKYDTNPKQYRGASTSTYRSNSKESDTSVSKEFKSYKLKSSRRSRSRSMSKSTEPYKSRSDRSASIEFKKNRERSKSSSKERSTRTSKSYDRRSNSNDSSDYKRYRERSLRSRSKSRSTKRSNSKEPMCYKSTLNLKSRENSPSTSRKAFRSKSRELSRSKSRSNERSNSKEPMCNKSTSNQSPFIPRKRFRSISREFSRSRSRSKSTSIKRSNSKEPICHKSFVNRQSREESPSIRRKTSRSKSREVSRSRSRSKSRSIQRSNSMEPMCYKSLSSRQSRDKSPSIPQKSSRSKSREFSRSRSRSKSGSIDKSKCVPRSRSKSSDSLKRAKSNKSNKSSSSSSSSSSSDSDV